MNQSPPPYAPGPDPYAPPVADLGVAQSTGPGSVEAALAGRIDFEIDDVLRSAWVKTKGVRLLFWGALITIYIGMLVVGLGLTLPFSMMADSPSFLLSMLTNLAAMAVNMVLAAGVWIIGIRRAAGRPVEFSHVFGGLDYALPLILTGLAMTFMTYLGFILLIIPGIYLSVAYYFALPLAFDKRMTVWEALETSRKAVTKKWFKVFLTVTATFIVIFLSILPLGIGLIWTVPWSVMVFGELYVRFFGVEHA